MAKLRDAVTSAIIAEGTPTELVLAAQHLSPGSYLYDDVGEAFDPNAVLEAFNTNLSGLQGALAEAQGQPSPNPKDVDSLSSAVDSAQQLSDQAPALASQAQTAMADAQAALQNPSA